MAVPGNEIFRSVDPEKFSGFRFLAASVQGGLWRNVMKHDPRISGLSTNRKTSIGNKVGFISPLGTVEVWQIRSGQL